MIDVRLRVILCKMHIRLVSTNTLEYQIVCLILILSVTIEMQVMTLVIF